jgi:REP element-mobilizing transposase RayT
LGDVIGWFKTMTTNACLKGVKQGWPAFSGRLWQRNDYERIVRDDMELHAIREYITNNPREWPPGDDNPATTPTRRFS